MPTVEERVTAIEVEIKKMDIDLKQHFTEFRAFVVETVDGVEKRLGARFDARFDGVDARLSGVDARLNAMDLRFSGMDARFNGIDDRLNGIDARLNGIDAKLVGIDSKLDTLLSRMP